MTMFRAARRASRLLAVVALLALWPACGTATPAVSHAAGSLATPPSSRRLGGTIHEFPLPGADQAPEGSGIVALATGPDGALWYLSILTPHADQSAPGLPPAPLTGTISRMTTAGATTTWRLPSAGTAAYDLAAGPDGALWFTEIPGAPGAPGGLRSGRIGRITATGQIREFTLPAGSIPRGIAAGPGHVLWFSGIAVDPEASPTQIPRGLIGRITTTGAVREFPLPAGTVATGTITAGPDQALWFAAVTTSSPSNPTAEIGRITPMGDVQLFRLPAGTTVLAEPLTGGGLVAGPDGNLWFTEVLRQSGRAIGRITPTGVVTTFPLPASMQPARMEGLLGGIAVGGDGALWFTDAAANAIGRITTTGAISEHPLPTANAGPTTITGGPDGTIWFIEATARRIGHLT